MRSARCAMNSATPSSGRSVAIELLGVTVVVIQQIDRRLPPVVVHVAPQAAVRRLVLQVHHRGRCRENSRRTPGAGHFMNSVSSSGAVGVEPVVVQVTASKEAAGNMPGPGRAHGVTVING